MRSRIWRPPLEVARRKLVEVRMQHFERLGQERGLIANFVRDEPADGDVCTWPMFDLVKYGQLLRLLPDHVVENLEKGRLARDGRYPLLKAGLGYEELLNSIIVDATAVGSSSAEAKLAPALVIPKNYMAPGGIPGRTLRTQLRGRITTLATAATLTLRNRIAATDIITGTILHATGAMTMDAAAQTNTQWEWEGHLATRSVGSAGTVFAQGDADSAALALTVATSTAKWSGSAGQAAPAAATYDTTGDQFFQQTAQWSLATAYSIQTHIYLLEALN